MRCSASFLNFHSSQIIPLVHSVAPELPTASASAMILEQSCRERAHSDKAQTMTATASQRPGIGGRTSSAPAGGLDKLDVVRKTASGTQVEHTLLEEDERTPITDEAIKHTRFSQQGGVRLELTQNSKRSIATVYNVQRASLADGSFHLLL